MKSETFTVEGMSCSNCVDHVTRALTALPGTSHVHVSLELGRATIEFDPKLVTSPQLIAAIDEEGYTAKPFEER